MEYAKERIGNLSTITLIGILILALIAHAPVTASASANVMNKNFFIITIVLKVYDGSYMFILGAALGVEPVNRLMWLFLIGKINVNL